MWFCGELPILTASNGQGDDLPQKMPDRQGFLFKTFARDKYELARE
jgi:hypothetical protein